MGQVHALVSEYAAELVSVPRAHLRMELEQDETGLRLTHDGKTVVHCRLSREGMIAGGFLAQALGVKVPALGASVPARVSTGVLYRAMAVAGLDYSMEESYVLLERLLDEAAAQRGGTALNE